MIYTSNVHYRSNIPLYVQNVKCIHEQPCELWAACLWIHFTKRLHHKYVTFNRVRTYLGNSLLDYCHIQLNHVYFSLCPWLFYIRTFYRSHFKFWKRLNNCFCIYSHGIINPFAKMYAILSAETFLPSKNNPCSKQNFRCSTDKDFLTKFKLTLCIKSISQCLLVSVFISTQITSLGPWSCSVLKGESFQSSFYKKGYCTCFQRTLLLPRIGATLNKRECSCLKIPFFVHSFSLMSPISGPYIFSSLVQKSIF